MKLVLGSAQWGQAYGIANRGGPPSKGEIRRILDEAWEAGVRTIDTAQAYGDAETRIGELASPRWEIVTKLSPELGDANYLPQALASARKRLRRDVLDVVMLHRPAQRLLPGMWDELWSAKERGDVRTVGVSVLSTDEADEEMYHVDALQVPASLVDQRLVSSGFFERVHEAGIRVFVRSVFLQGVATLEAKHLPASLRALGPSLDRLRMAAGDCGISLEALFLAYARDRFQAEIVVGVERFDQLRANIDGWQLWRFSDGELGELERLVDASVQREELLNPAWWPR